MRVGEGESKLIFRLKIQDSVHSDLDTRAWNPVRKGVSRQVHERR